MGEKDMHESELNAAQPARRPKKKKRGRAGKVIRKTVKIVVVLVLAVGAGLFGLKAYIGKQAKENQNESYSRAAVTRGAMEETVYGTGTTAARNQTHVLAGADGTLTDLRVSVGDEVKAGDILAVLTNADLDDEITDLEFDLWELDDTILDTGTGSKVTAVEAPAAGRVMAVYANVGDDALAVFRREGALAVISTDGRMKVELSGLSGSLLELGQTVAIRGKGIETTGKVVSLTRRDTEATVEVASDEYDMDVPVTAYAQAGETVGEGMLEINKPMAVSAYGGTIKGLLVKVGDRCERYDALARIEWDEIPLYLDNASVLRDYDKALVSLEAAYRKRDALAVTAPCDGVVATLDASQGDSVTDGTKLMSIVEADAGLTLTLAVDELDILSVQPGQRVALSVDALPNAALTGVVQKVAPLGDTSSGVTTYDVTVTVSGEDERVKGGMNVSGEIIVNAEDDAILIPTDALQKDGAGYCVTLESGETRRVTLGVMTDETTQILDGIGVGETVIY